MRQLGGVDRGPDEVRTSPPFLLAGGTNHDPDRDAARKHPTQPRRPDHRPGPSAPCGAAMPTTLPSVAMALARNSGCAQLSTTLVCSSTLATNPTNPSGLTTADSGRTPSRLPAETTKLSGLVGSG